MDKFFSSLPQRHPASKRSGPADTSEDAPPVAEKKRLPKGIVLGKDGKPCRSCTSVSAWMAMANQASTTGAPSSSVTDSSSSTPFSSTPSSSASSTPPTSSASPPIHPPAPAPPTSSYPPTLPPDCPPDVEALGRSTWTLLHTLGAHYPPRPSPLEQTEMSQFLTLFSKLYPCWHCAEDFRDWIERRRKVGEGVETAAGKGQEGLSRWLCEAHNEVNRKLGREEFDCGRWRERWGEGPGDGRCG